jgi:hypothetical protein
MVLLARLIWYAITEGSFQAVLNVRASSDLMGRTKKSLNKCHSLSAGVVGRECATVRIRQQDLNV